MSRFIYAYDFVEFLPMKSDSITCNRQSSNFPFNTCESTRYSKVQNHISALICQITVSYLMHVTKILTVKRHSTLYSSGKVSSYRIYMLFVGNKNGMMHGMTKLEVAMNTPCLKTIAPNTKILTTK